MIIQCAEGHAFLGSQNPKCPWCQIAELDRELDIRKAAVEAQFRLLKDVEDLKKALRASSVALDDWINTYASEFCNEKHVAEALARIDENGGTLAYIARLQQTNKSLMAT